MAERSYPTSKVRGGSQECQAMTAQEQPPQVQGQGRKPGGPHAREAAARRSYPKPKARGGGREEPPHVQGAVAAGAQECLEELLHLHGQEGQQ